MFFSQVSRFDTNSQTMAFMRLRLDDRGVWVVGETYRIPRIPEAMKTIAMGEAVTVKKGDRVRGRGSEKHTHTHIHTYIHTHIHTHDVSESDEPKVALLPRLC